MEKKEIQEFKLKLLEDEIECVKETLDRHIKVLAKYSIIKNAFKSIFFQELFDQELIKGIDFIHDAKISQKEKDRLRTYSFFWFGNKGNTKEDILKDNLEYYKRLVKSAEFYLEELPLEIKEKIIRKGIERNNMWLKQSVINHKIYEELKQIKKKEVKNVINRKSKANKKTRGKNKRGDKGNR